MNKTKLIWAAVLLFTASCANEDVSKETESGSQNNQVLTTFTSGDEPATRTSITRWAAKANSSGQRATRYG